MTEDKPVNPGWLAFGGVLALASAMGIGRFIYTPILPAMVQGLELSKSDAGLIASANFLGYLAGALLAASSRISGSPRVILLSGLLISAVTTMAVGWTLDMVIFLVLRFAGGVASAFVLVFTSALILERLNAIGRADLSTRHFAGVGTGIAVSAIVTWGVAQTTGNWADMWVWGGVFSLAIIPVVAFALPHRPMTGSTAKEEKPGPVSKMIWPLIVAYGLFGFGYVITATFIVAIVREMPDVRAYESLIWFVLGVAGMPSIAAWNWFGRKTGGVLVAFAVACLVEAAGVVGSVYTSSVIGLALCGASLGGTFMAITALGLFAARTIAPERARQVLALMTAAFGFGQVVGPIVAGYGYDLTGSFVMPSLVAAAALIISTILSLFVWNRVRV